MTFIDPPCAVGDVRAALVRRRAARLVVPRHRVDEDGARRAFGADLAFAHTVAAGATIEHLARIALG